MQALKFVRKHRQIYFLYTPLGLALVLAFASIQILIRIPHPTPQFFIMPSGLGLAIGLMLATLVAMRREVLSSQWMFRAAADLAQEFVYIRRVDGSYEYVSPSCLDLTGYLPDAFYAHPSFMNQLVHPEDRPKWDSHVHQMDHHGQPEKLVVRILTKDGKVRWVQHLCSDVRDASGEIVGVRSTNLDITERIEWERELALSAVAFQTHDAIVITDRNAHILRVNRAFTEITGYSRDEVIGLTPASFKSGMHDDEFYAGMWATLNATGCWSGEVWDRRKNGEYFPKHLKITAVTDQSGEVEYFVGNFSDITRRKADEAEIYRLAYYDALTQLPNRRLLHERMSKVMASGVRHGRLAALLFIDLDRFKLLNDTRGHDVGDQWLIEVAHRLRSCVREVDIVARLGGDEFVVLLEDIAANEADTARRVEIVAEKILDVINTPFLLDDYDYQGSASIGVTLVCGKQENPEEIFKHADVALYRAKEEGRARICFFDPAMQAALNVRARLEAELRSALADRQFRLHYQAQVDASGRIVGAEALLRWAHPERGIVSPHEFIPFAEECGLILPLGRWVLETACDQLKIWAAADAQLRELNLAINVSAAQFMQPNFVKEILATLQLAGVEPRRLKLELTESALVHDIQAVTDKMMTLKTAGIGFSLDDFGTGYSSLAYLRELPLDQLKIGHSFIENIVSDANDATLAQTIIGMARNLGLDVIAEGVETRAQHALLEQQGCPGYQGYLFSRPLPLADFEALVRNWPVAANGFSMAGEMPSLYEA